MALTPTPNEAFFREVDEAVRQDDLRSFWTRYGRWLVVLLVIGLAAFGGWLYWQSHKQQQAEETSEQFVQLLAGAASGNVNKAALTRLTQADQPGYRAAALLTRAGVESQQGDAKSAIATYAALAADAKLPQPFRDVATIRQTALEFDSLPPQQVIDRLKPLAEVGNPWFGSAGEMTALAWLKLGKTDLAGPLFAAIAKDPSVPRTIQTRAVQMASLLGVDAEIAPRPGEPKENSINAE